MNRTAYLEGVGKRDFPCCVWLALSKLGLFPSILNVTIFC